MTTLRPVVVQAAEAEVLTDGNPMRLLADADASGGAVSISSGTIAAGADNALPHLHRRSWEVFYIVGGALEIMLDERIEVVSAGGLVAVPPGVVHAFAATDAGDVEAVVFITPGVARFDYFRMLPKVLRGEYSKPELDAMHERFDIHFRDSPVWRARRSVVGQSGAQ